MPGIKELPSRFHQLNKILKQWNRIRQQDYLTSLREHHYDGGTASVECRVQPGDIVLIDCDGPWTSWALERIVSLLPDKNGTVRVIKVLSKGNVTLRTIGKLISLEISSDMPEDKTINTPTERRPKRQATLKIRAQWHDSSPHTKTEVED
ncbi:hypothetical protein E2C01_093012 [Portunus trituberculatus]|uniref:DUF5641 domain-containing protein n=1 Tax=Portunus trituberculatus TaxID=210409 RepID=A0A5B7JX16_PORTR|nr:hypothetical protein [Portunus trituberculatus]